METVQKTYKNRESQVREIEDLKAVLARKRAAAVITIYDEVRRRGSVVIPTEENSGNRMSDLYEDDKAPMVRMKVSGTDGDTHGRKANVLVDRLDLTRDENMGDAVFICGYVLDDKDTEEVCVELCEAEIDEPETLLGFLVRSEARD